MRTRPTATDPDIAGPDAATSNPDSSGDSTPSDKDSTSADASLKDKSGSGSAPGSWELDIRSAWGGWEIPGAGGGFASPSLEEKVGVAATF